MAAEQGRLYHMLVLMIILTAAALALVVATALSESHTNRSIFFWSADAVTVPVILDLGA